jgi:molybdopterin synthase catalytic subunit
MGGKTPRRRLLDVLEQPLGDNWIGISDVALPVNEAIRWATDPTCGGIVTFCGTVRDHSDGHPDVTQLEYEAYDEYVVPVLREVANQARATWPMLTKIVIMHRIGVLCVGEPAVVVVVATPHRGEAFAAGEFVIDAVKATAPIWKRETWSGGSEWVACAHEGHSHGRSAIAAQAVHQ